MSRSIETARARAGSVAVLICLLALPLSALSREHAPKAASSHQDTAAARTLPQDGDGGGKTNPSEACAQAYYVCDPGLANCTGCYLVCKKTGVWNCPIMAIRSKWVFE